MYLIEDLTIDQLSELTANKVLERLRELLPQKNDEIYLDRKQVSKMLGITFPTLTEYCKQGIIPSYRIGRRILFKETEIREAVTKSLRYSHNRKGGCK